MPEKLIRHSGNYRKLLSYQKSEVIFEMTYYFCHNYLKKGDRTVDQMVQAARSGKQNIIEGCAASTRNHCQYGYHTYLSGRLSAFQATRASGKGFHHPGWFL